MHVQISCEECGRRYKIAESTVRGKRIVTRCKCGARVVVEDPARAGKSSSTTGSIHRKDRWFVNITSAEPLPMSLESLVRAFEVGRIDTETLVWRRGMVDWALLREVKELSLLLLGDQTGRKLHTLPPPTVGGSQPPPPPTGTAPGADAEGAPAPKARPVNLRLEERNDTRTGLGVVSPPPAENTSARPTETTSGGRYQQSPPSRNTREFGRLAAELEESGPATEPLGVGHIARASQELAQGRQVASDSPSSFEVPRNLAEPAKSAQTPISMSSSSPRSHKAVSGGPLAGVKTRHYLLLAAVVGSISAVMIVASLPSSNTLAARNSRTSRTPEAAPSIARHNSSATSSSPTAARIKATPQLALPSAALHTPTVAPVPNRLQGGALNPGASADVAAVPSTSGAVGAPQSQRTVLAPRSKQQPSSQVRHAVATRTRSTVIPSAGRSAPVPPTVRTSTQEVLQQASATPSGRIARSKVPTGTPAQTGTMSKVVAQVEDATGQTAVTLTVSKVAGSTPPKAVEEVPDTAAKPAVRTFERELALAQAASAALKAALCGGVPAAGRVRIVVEPWGTVGRVRHLNQAFVGTKTGICVMQAFQKVRVPAFDGSAQTVESSFSIH